MANQGQPAYNQSVYTGVAAPPPYYEQHLVPDPATGSLTYTQTYMLDTSPLAASQADAPHAPETTTMWSVLQHLIQRVKERMG